jgi:hypothetical protein
MKYFIASFFIFQIFVSFSKSASIHIYLVVDNFQMTKSEYQNWSNSIFLETKLPITDFKIYSHSLKESFFPDTWTNEKKTKTAHFYPSKIDCEYSPCSTLKSLIQEYSTAKTKLFIGEGEFNCNLRDFGVENGYFKNNADDIKLKIEEEIEANKSAGKELTLIFYVPSISKIEKPTISFKIDTLKIKKGEIVTLSPSISEDSKVKWDSFESLSCLDCSQPKASPSSTTTYTVRSKNTSGCDSEPAKITVEVSKRCDDSFESCKILYFSDSQLYKKNLEDKNKWLMSSSQPGSEIYYLVCEKNCADNVTVEIFDKNHQKIWNQDYKRSDIESGNKLHQDHPDNFIFKLNLNKINNFDKNQYYTFEIKSRNEDKDSFGNYVSPLTKFVECGL